MKNLNTPGLSKIQKKYYLLYTPYNNTYLYILIFVHEVFPGNHSNIPNTCSVCLTKQSIFFAKDIFHNDKLAVRCKVIHDWFKSSVTEPRPQTRSSGRTGGLLSADLNYGVHK